ncbi:MAG: ComEC/Rec2 family competence protein [Candidatus Liptonbacteria bacterium]|nr:ComEC/Rec2 family competence protein [Candidatus Liptonbacteria bacterium]
MRLYDIVFYSAIFFMVGIVFASFRINGFFILLVSFVVFLLFLALSLFKRSGFMIGRPLAVGCLAFFIIIGAFYYHLFFVLQNENIVFNKEIDFHGLIVNDPKIGINNQEFLIEIQPPFKGKIKVYSNVYPSWQYGDILSFNGEIRKTSRGKNILSFPEMELVKRNTGSDFKFFLYELRQSMSGNLNKVLPSSSAALINGILFGETKRFDSDFKDALIETGTIHIVALSGYNVLIITLGVSSLFSYFSSRRKSFYLTILAVLGFVLMTGAEPSTVRAAIMGILVLTAKQMSRLSNLRNSVTLTAFSMTLFNPNFLVFDLGFQLSFLALLGIVYFEPKIKKILKFGDEEGFFGWKKNFLTTISAQLGVLPLLLLEFGRFSWFSFLPNILILNVIPITMLFGFLTAVSGFISNFLAVIIGLILNILLRYEIGVINIFSYLF